MNLDKLVTVVPNDAAALARVETPFTAFEHPFRDRASRLEHQIEAIGNYCTAILLGDTWPDAYYDQMSWGRMRTIIKKYPEQQRRWAQIIWPETALYLTGVAQLLGVNERVRYRSQLWTFCQWFEKCNKTWHEDLDILAEGTIYVKNRVVYSLEYPALKLSSEQCELSIIYYGSMNREDWPSIPDGTEIIIMGTSEPDGNTFNEGLKAAHGKYVAICREGDIVDIERFRIQIADDADLSLSPVADGGDPWLLRGYTERVDKPSEQLSSMLFRRSIFNRIPGAHPDMQAGFDYDLFVRITADTSMTVAYHSKPLVARKLQFPYGRVYTQQVYNDAANRVRYTKDYHALSIRGRPLGERVLPRS